MSQGWQRPKLYVNANMGSEEHGMVAFPLSYKKARIDLGLGHLPVLEALRNSREEGNYPDDEERGTCFTRPAERPPKSPPATVPDAGQMDAC